MKERGLHMNSQSEDEQDNPIEVKTKVWGCRGGVEHVLKAGQQ
jgi:hypothetical protein